VIWLRRERGVEWLAPPIDVGALAQRVTAWRLKSGPSVL
jgi:hypothetical protein